MNYSTSTRGRWVAVNEEGDVVADADKLDLLLAELKRHAERADTKIQVAPALTSGIFVHHGAASGRRVADLVVQRVPEADAPLFVGLG